MNTKTHTRRKVDHYLELVKAFPLKPIRTDAQYAAAGKVLTRLVVRPEGSLTAGEQDYMEALTMMVEAFDREHVRLIPGTTPLHSLRFLMREGGLKVADIGRLIGSASAASMLLSGDREMSKSQIRVLAAHFKVDASYFL